AGPTATATAAPNGVATTAGTDGTDGTDGPYADRGSPGQGSPSASNRAALAAAAKVSRSEVIARAQSWVGIGLKYSWNTTYEGYRTDCSGFASMAWKLGKPGLDTTSFGPAGVTVNIGKGELKPGDALLNKAAGANGHIVLFDKWVDGSQGSYWGYEFSGSGMHHRQIPYPYFSGHGTFVPVRNVAVIDDGPTLPPLDLSDSSKLPGGTLVREPGGSMAVAAGGALLPFGSMAELTEAGYANRMYYNVGSGYIGSASHQPVSGTLIRSGPSPSVYVTAGGGRVVFRDEADLAEARYDMSRVVVVPSSFVASLPEGVAEGSLIRSGPESTVYVTINGARIPFLDEAELAQAGYDIGRTVVVPLSYLSTLHTGATNGTLIRVGPDPTVYVTIDGARVPFKDADELAAAGYDITRTAVVPVSFMSGLSQRLPDGTLIRTGSEPTVYVTVNGARVPFNDADELAVAGYDITRTIKIPTSYLNTLPQTIPDATLIRTGDNASVYVTAGGARIPFTTETELTQAGYDITHTVKIPTTHMNTLPTEPADGTLVRTGPDPTVYLLAGGAKLTVPTVTDLTDAGYDITHTVTTPTTWTNQLPTTPRNGTLVRGPGTTQTWLVTNATRTPTTPTTDAHIVPLTAATLAA
ncbi:hypothetical protein GT354_38605, partial [Streptomyces sp. SID3343]|nr:hypothetical protein [Streptomyces sp. SID3343]